MNDGIAQLLKDYFLEIGGVLRLFPGSKINLAVGLQSRLFCINNLHPHGLMNISRHVIKEAGD
jgi:hypothetical protein